MIIAEYYNSEYGIASVVHQTAADRFPVKLVDTDAGITFDAAMIFQSLDEAIEHAKLLVKQY